MMQSLLAKEAGTYRPTYLPVFYFILILLQSFLVPTYLAKLYRPASSQRLSVCLCLGTYLANLTDLPS
jgi:hypothetical protein